MTDPIRVATEHVRPPADITVREAVHGHADPDGAAELLGATRETEDAPETTLDEFGDSR